MNWKRVAIAGVVAGIVMNIVDFIAHGVILAPYYVQYPDVFNQEGGKEYWFPVISICVALAGVALYAKTRSCWETGVGGGATFGFMLGLVGLFAPLYNPIVLEGFPYYLAWCWGFVGLLDAVVLGVLASVLYKD